MTAALVVFGDDWGRHPSTTRHLVSHLPADFPVVRINSIGMRPPRLRLADFSRVIEKMGRWRDAARSGARKDRRPCWSTR